MVCRDYLRELDREKVDTSEWNVIDCDEDLTYSMEVAVLDDIPMTRIYQDGKVVWEKGGIPYATQRKELLRNLPDDLEKTAKDLDNENVGY